MTATLEGSPAGTLGNLHIPMFLEVVADQRQGGTHAQFLAPRV